MKRALGLLALVLAVLMIFAACGAGGTNKAASTAEQSTAASTSAASTAPAAPPTELNMMYLGNPQTDVALVEEAINKILIPKINVKLKITGVSAGAYMQQQNLVLSSGEKVDLMMTFPFTYLSLVSQGKIQEIGPLLDKYGSGIKDALGKYLEGSKVNGKIYGVRPMSDFAGGGGFTIRKDIVDKYKIDLTTLKSFRDIGNVLKVIKDNEPKTFPLTYSSQAAGILEYAMQFDVDKLGDYFGAIMYNATDLKVVNIFESQYYADNVKMMRDWYTKGYIMKDVATATEDNRTLVKSGKAYCYINPTKPGIEVQESAQCGYQMVTQQYSNPVSCTSNITLFQWVVPNACTAPDKAVQLLNEMYTNADLENLLSYGIEGKHYEKKADGTIGFPAGVTDKTSGYFLNSAWMMGNEFIAHVWNGNSPDVWEKTKELNASATLSKAMGFSYDATPVKTEVAAVTNVYNQYKKGLESGSVDPSKVLPEFLSKLKASGIDKIIAEKQKQLDAWSQANKK